MKRIILTALLAFCMVPLMAQTDFYKKYSKTEGITKVYISPSLFSLFGENSNINMGSGADMVNLSSVINKLTGLYVLSTEKADVAQRMQADFEKIIKEENYELLLEAEDGEDVCVIYILREAQLIKELFICGRDTTEFSFIQISGSLTQEDINTIVEMSEDN